MSPDMLKRVTEESVSDYRGAEENKQEWPKGREWMSGTVYCCRRNKKS